MDRHRPEAIDGGALGAVDVLVRGDGCDSGGWIERDACESFEDDEVAATATAVPGGSALEANDAASGPVCAQVAVSAKLSGGLGLGKRLLTLEQVARVDLDDGRVVTVIVAARFNHVSELLLLLLVCEDPIGSICESVLQSRLRLAWHAGDDGVRRSRSGRGLFEMSDQGAGVRRGEVNRDDQGGEEDYIVREGEQGHVRRRHRSARRHQARLIAVGPETRARLKTGAVEARQERGSSWDLGLEACSALASVSWL